MLIFSVHCFAEIISLIMQENSFFYCSKMPKHAKINTSMHISTENKRFNKK